MIEGLKRLRNERQQALKAIYSAGTTGIDEAICEENFELFERSLEDELKVCTCS